MKIYVHRGLNQVGGCITEISTETSRIFVDFGQNLPGVGVPSTPEEDRQMVESIISQNTKVHQAVVYTHAHSDHVGLFNYIPDDIPQYIAEGGQEILLAKYGMMKNTIKYGIIRKLEHFHTWKSSSTSCNPFIVGDIRITPFRNSHSIYDSYMFLIEADGKRVWHTGDYRYHGYLGDGLFSTLKLHATNIDVLITEGTMLNRDDECIHEAEVSHRMAEEMEKYKYVVVLASATDIERLASIKEAAQKAKKKMFVCGHFMKKTMEIFTRREAGNSNGLFDFHPKSFNLFRRFFIKSRGFVLIAGASQLLNVKALCGDLASKDILLIYSSWDGYYKDPAQVAINPNYKNFRDAFSNVIDIHTSGHADKATIHRVIEMVSPKEVICIHKEADAIL